MELGSAGHNLFLASDLAVVKRSCRWYRRPHMWGPVPQQGFLVG